MHELLQRLRGGTDQALDLAIECGRRPAIAAQWYSRYCMLWTLVVAGLVGVPLLYWGGSISIETVNQLGRYLCFAIVALSLDLIWGYGGMLCLCQFLFFSLGGYAMGMYCAHHGGPEGIIDAVNWGKIPACLFVVYPGQVGESQEQWTVPFFWRPFWNIWVTILLGMIIPGVVAGVIGFFVFRSRVRGVFFAVLTQAIVLAFWLMFCMVNMKLGGTNGLTRFDRIVLGSREKIALTIHPEKLSDQGLTLPATREAINVKSRQIAEDYLLQIQTKRDLLAEHSGSPTDVYVDSSPIVVSGDDARIVITLARSLHVWETKTAFERLEVADGVSLADVADIRIEGYNLNDNDVKLALYVLTVIMLTVIFLLCRLLMKSRMGRVLVAIRDNENRLRFSGYRPYVFKMLVFALSGVIAGIGGMLYAPQMKIFTPTNLEPQESIGVVIFAAVGGRGTLSGPILGALAVSYLYSSLTSKSPDAWPIVLGLLFVLVTLYLPKGLMGIWHSWLSLDFSTRASRRSLVASDELTADQKRRDQLTAVVGVLTLAIGLFAAISLWHFAKPTGDGLMTQRNGSSAVVGLTLLLTALCAALQVPAGLAMLPGRAWGQRMARWTLLMSLWLLAGVVTWNFFIHQFTHPNVRSGLWQLCLGILLGLWEWAWSGCLSTSNLFSEAPAALVFGAWAIVALVLLRKFAWQPSVADEDLEEAADESDGPHEVPSHESISRQIERIVAHRRFRSQDNLSLLDSELLKVDGIRVVFDGFKALDIESFSIDHYDLNVIIGPNGAGKTTLCDVISGKTRPTEGSVIFDGLDITELPEADIARLGVGRKFQTPNVFDSLTVYQNMELALPGRDRLIRNFGDRPTAEEHDRIEAILSRVNLNGEANREGRYLSHGQRQWLEISMLVLSSPKLLLVDEPAAGLTDKEALLTAELLLELQEKHSVIVIEHDMEFVRLLNSRVTVLNEGVIMAQGDMATIQQDAAVQEAYLGR
ncbi:MAG: urea ABC transporter ATP-binding protein UrtD [Planctomycetaceae bacterium]